MLYLCFMFRKFIFIIISILFCLPLQAQIEIAFQNFENSTALQGAYVGMSVVDISTGNIVFENNGNKLFYPASVQKTITTASALQLLGKDYRYETKVYYTGEIINGKLNGNLLINAVGDPTLNSKYFNINFLQQVTTALKENGIEVIEGKVILQNSPTTHNTVPTWLYEDIANYYGVAPQIFNYKDDAYTLIFQQTGHDKTPELKTIRPKVPYNFNLELKCSNTTRRDKAYIMGTAFSKEREVIGTIPSGSRTFRVKGGNAHPFESFVNDLNTYITIKNKEIINTNQQELCIVKSNSLLELVEITNNESINLFAESMLNTLGLEFGKSYTPKAGIEVIENLIEKSSEVNKKEIRIKDGSGLSRLNAMTPNFAANWLCSFFSNKDFVNSLPISGETGTMRYISAANLKGKIQAKSGSADGVTNYAGYLYTNNGKTYAFSIFINNAYTNKPTIRKNIEVLLESLL